MKKDFLIVDDIESSNIISNLLYSTKQRFSPLLSHYHSPSPTKKKRMKFYDYDKIEGVKRAGKKLINRIIIGLCLLCVAIFRSDFTMG